MRELDVREVAPRPRPWAIRSGRAEPGGAAQWSRAAGAGEQPGPARAVPCTGVRRPARGSAAARAAARWALPVAGATASAPSCGPVTVVAEVPAVPVTSPARTWAPASRVVRPPGRRCVAPVRRVRPALWARSRGERLLAGAAIMLCSATVVVVLGLLGDAASGWNSELAPPPGPAAVPAGR
ncbi:hypothetical protein [Pseudonocardia sp. NPDC049635]|uniref:hypothetical protein n=1 Tax=Pseudonocardia sp. NPDC049635 TaxID=3155506 RepID=UPI0033D0BBEC